MDHRRAVRPEADRSLAYGPLPLWRLVDPDGQPPEAPATPSGPSRSPTRRKPYRLPEPLDEFDSIYRAFAENLGWHPRDVDRLEVWEAARLLGRPDGTPVVTRTIPSRFKDDAAAGGPAVLEGGGSSMGDDLQARRVLAAKGEAPPPDWT